MDLTSVPTERTTAATDVGLALFAAVAIHHLRRLRAHDSWKTALWSWVFGLTGVAALLGAIVHGLDVPGPIPGVLWRVLLLLLGVVVALFVVAAVYDLRGRVAATRALPAMIGVAMVFWGLTFAFEGSFLPFVVYETVAMLLALGVYLRLAGAGRAQGASVIALAIGLNLVAAGLQASGVVRMTVVWPFDHNGIFHLVQILALAVLLLGLHRSLVGTAPAGPG